MGIQKYTAAEKLAWQQDYVSGMPTVEIAEKYSVPQSAVQNCVYEYRRALKKEKGIY